MFQRTFIALLIFPLISCGIGSEFFKGNIETSVKGSNNATAEMSVEEAYENFRSQLEANEGIIVIAELNHSSNAKSAGMELPASRIIFFGNPEMSTQLIKRNQLAGLDLPLRVLFYEKDKQVVALFNSASYLERRYGFTGAGILDKISANLDGLVGKAMNTEVVWGKGPDIRISQGIKTVNSTRDFNDTWNALIDILEKNDDIKIVAELDYKANAADVDMELRPTRLIMFGNPTLGTPLMQSAMSTGLELPQKILLWQDEDGEVNISYNAPEFLRFRHGFTGRSTELETISTALDNLAKTAAGLE